MRAHKILTALALLGLSSVFVPMALAVPYASGVRNTSGSTWEFVLNEASDSVTVLRDGGNAVDLGALSAGRHSFDLAAFSSFDIQVQSSAPSGWTTISNSANAFTNFERPYGLAVNNIPSSPYFGTVYVNNSTTLSTASGRTMGDGIYALTADLVGVDLANNFSVVGDPNDASQAKAPHWTVAGSSNSAFHLALDEAGNLIASDWSDANGGIKYATPDLAHGGPLLVHEDGIRPLLAASPDGNTGPEVHGSIVSTPYVTGSVGNNLVVYAIDEDLDSDGETLIDANTGNHLWRWNVGNVTNEDPAINPSLPDEFGGGYDQAPDLIVNATPLATANSDGSPAFFDLNIGVLADATYSPIHDKWYFTQGRNDGNESSLAVVTADGVDGNSPTLEWSSKQFSIDNSLDGFADVTIAPASTGLQDIFREIGAVTISPDGNFLYAHRGFVYGDSVIINPNDPPELQQSNNNPYLGLDTAYPGQVLIIPLDANGLPDIQIDDNGTPGDPSDDVITNLESIDLGSNSDYSRVPITLDAAGNVYITNHVAELLEVYSPGGSWLATTSGTAASGNTGFTITPSAVGLTGDYNNDGKVDAADYVVWRKTGINGQQGYDDWRDNFGAMAMPGGGSAVPEPSALVLCLIGVGSIVARWVRR